MDHFRTWLHFIIIFMSPNIIFMLFLSLLTNVLQFFIDMAASQPNKATMKGLEDGEGGSSHKEKGGGGRRRERCLALHIRAMM